MSDSIFDRSPDVVLPSFSVDHKIGPVTQQNNTGLLVPVTDVVARAGVSFYGQRTTGGAKFGIEFYGRPPSFDTGRIGAFWTSELDVSHSKKIPVNVGPSLSIGAELELTNLGGDVVPVGFYGTADFGMSLFHTVRIGTGVDIGVKSIGPHVTVGVDLASLLYHGVHNLHRNDI